MWVRTGQLSLLAALTTGVTPLAESRTTCSGCFASSSGSWGDRSVHLSTSLPSESQNLWNPSHPSRRSHTSLVLRHSSKKHRDSHAPHPSVRAILTQWAALPQGVGGVSTEASRNRQPEKQGCPSKPRPAAPWGSSQERVGLPPSADRLSTTTTGVLQRAVDGRCISSVGLTALRAVGWPRATEWRGAAGLPGPSGWGCERRALTGALS